MKIKISKNGPYIVSGNIPMKEKIIVTDNLGYKIINGKDLPQKNTYAICRCGKSLNSPFCDGSHIKSSFDGTETADRRPFIERAKKTEGKTADLLDDGRCALARVCHRNSGCDFWELFEDEDTKEVFAEAVKAANECPAGRLVIADKNGRLLESAELPAVEILTDEEMNCGGAMIVKGAIEIEAADGYVYEKRPRVALCRCGNSSNKPFCDGTHIHT